MEQLISSIDSTPIIDNHAHPLLLPSAREKYPLLSITSEASGKALKSSLSSLPHFRAIKDLSRLLKCAETWDDVVASIKKEVAKPNDVWAKTCLDSIQTIFLDDGLNMTENEVHDYSWHDRLVSSKCKRIARIEPLAERIITRQLSAGTRDPFVAITQDFNDEIERLILDLQVVGFKSVISYRTGLDLPGRPDIEGSTSALEQLLKKMRMSGTFRVDRLANKSLNDYFVHLTASKISKTHTGHKKPIQFHVGLGDNDVQITRSSPGHLQDFIRAYSDIPIILLHASYPWTKEAGFLACVYANVYADIGLIFPMVSKDGQERVLREILEVCATEKVVWSTDGHWFAETFLLATMQVKETMKKVFPEYVRNGTLTINQAVKAVEDILFNTSNRVYNLDLSPIPAPAQSLAPRPDYQVNPDVENLRIFLDTHPDVKFLRIQYLDYTATLRLRILPVKRVREMIQAGKNIAITLSSGGIGVTQKDHFAAGFDATGEHQLTPIFSSIRSGPRKDYASIAGELRHSDAMMSLCPRTLLRRLQDLAKTKGFTFLLGFEIEIVFMSKTVDSEGLVHFHQYVGCSAQSWSGARAMDSPEICEVIADIYEALGSADIHLDQLHPEASPGQFEFVLPPLSPLAAVDTLIQAREIIVAVCNDYAIRATMFPKPFPTTGGTGLHAHLSITSAAGDEKETYEAFYAGVLCHLPAITAFTLPSESSWDRVVDSCYAGSRWITWGTLNREVQLRKIKDSHWEIKCFDGMANGYLGIGVIIAAGLNGVDNGKTLISSDCQGDPAGMSPIKRAELGITDLLPGNVDAALESLRKDEALLAILGKDFVDAYINVKETEHRTLESMNAQEKREWYIARY